MGVWEPVGIDSPLMRLPTGLTSAPALPRLDLLPFNALDWPTFEKLQLRMMSDVLGLRDPRQYGEPGQKQEGIDLIATAANGTETALQSKNYAKFGLSDLRDAVRAFRESERKVDVAHLIIGVSDRVRRTEILQELRKLQEQIAPVTLDLWDAQRLSDLLRKHHEIVAQFFTWETARQFCGDFEVRIPTIAHADTRIISDAVTLAPEVLTGAQELLDSAQRSADAAESIHLIEQAQHVLRAAGFDAYATRHEPARAELLVQVGRERDAAREILQEVWASLDRGRTVNAQVAFDRMRKLAGERTHNPAVADLVKVGEMAFSIYMNPMGYLPEPSALLIGDDLDRARLMLLAGETALALDDTGWLKSAASAMSELAEATALRDDAVTRLRLLIAEAQDDWAPLLEEARRKRLRSELTPLIAARYARYCGLRERFEEADARWEEAASLACLVRQWEDAGTWILSKRAYLTNWQPFSGNDLVAMEIALSEQKHPTPPVIPRASRAYEEALGALQEENIRAAGIAAQRALRDAVVSSDWSGERKARTVLAIVMQAADEPERAATHLARAGESKKIEALGSAYPSQFIDVTAQLTDRTYWTVGAAYRLIATQADVVPDDRVDDIASAIAADLAAADAGDMTDVAFFAASRYNNAIRALAGLSERLRVDHADAALAHFEAQPPVGSNQYRYHDDHEAAAVAGIARAHPDLAPRAIAHLVPLLARASGARNNSTLETLDRYPDLARPALHAVDGPGGSWAAEMLAYADPEHIDREAAAQALERMTTPLKHTPGVFTVGTNAVGDSLLLVGQPQEALVRVVAEMMNRAEDPNVSGFDRGNYLSAAANLATDLNEPSKKTLFPTAARLAEEFTPSVRDEFHRRHSHPLSAVRINTSGSDRRGHAVFLASRLTTTDDERAEVRRLAYALLGSGSDFYPTQALQNLGEAMKDDISFLAGQDWAMRSLASILWARHGGAPHVGARLAKDSDVRVREVLAQALASSTAAHGAPVMQMLAADPSYRVRRALRDGEQHQGTA